MGLLDDLYRDVTAILANRHGIDTAEIEADTDLFEDLGLDSLDLLGTAQLLQSIYHIQLDNESIADVQTVADIVTLVEKQAVSKEQSADGIAQPEREITRPEQEKG